MHNQISYNSELSFFIFYCWDLFFILEANISYELFFLASNTVIRQIPFTVTQTSIKSQLSIDKLENVPIHIQYLNSYPCAGVYAWVLGDRTVPIAAWSTVDCWLWHVPIVRGGAAGNNWISGA